MVKMPSKMIFLFPWGAVENVDHIWVIAARSEGFRLSSDWCMVSKSTAAIDESTHTLQLFVDVLIRHLLMPDTKLPSCPSGYYIKSLIFQLVVIFTRKSCHVGWRRRRHGGRGKAWWRTFVSQSWVSFYRRRELVVPPRNIWVEDNVTVKKMRRNLAWLRRKEEVRKKESKSSRWQVVSCPCLLGCSVDRIGHLRPRGTNHSAIPNIYE